MDVLKAGTRCLVTTTKQIRTELPFPRRNALEYMLKRVTVVRQTKDGFYICYNGFTYFSIPKKHLQVLEEQQVIPFLNGAFECN